MAQTHERFDDYQCTYIDLPGEQVQCVRTHDHLKVILRKHRDVIFDINMKKGLTYTVESEASDFFHPDSKTVYRRHKPLVFKDGERLHIWVARDFVGNLILKQGNHVLARYDLQRIDPTKYSHDPKEKPAPFIVTIGLPAQKPVAKPTVASAAKPSIPTPAIFGSTGQAAIPQSKSGWSTPGKDWFKPDAETEHMFITEIDHAIADMAEETKAFIAGGKDDLMLNGVPLKSRNWFFTQIAGTAAYYNDNKHWIDELFANKFYLKKIIHKKAGPKWYIIFKGNQKLRTFMTASKYAVGNPKVLAITAGFGSGEGLMHKAWGASKDSLKKAGGLAVVFTIVLDSAEWISDYQQIDPKTGKHKKDFFDLAAKIGTDLLKAGIGAAAGAIVMAAIVGFIGTAVLPVGLIVVGAIAVAWGVGYLLDLADDHYHLTEKASEAVRTHVEYLEHKMPNDYTGYNHTFNSAKAGMH